MSDASEHDTVDDVPVLGSGVALAAGPVVVDAAGRTHVGKVRPTNEDNFHVARFGRYLRTVASSLTPPDAPDEFEQAGFGFSVADGVGGHPAGEVASALVARQLAQAGPSLDSEESVREAIGLCHEAVLAAGSASPGRAGMATTVAGVVVTADHVLAFNVGDSRVYLAGPDGVRQLSTDDRPDDDDGRRTDALGLDVGLEPA